jgi:hypothetical protein
MVSVEQAAVQVRLQPMVVMELRIEATAGKVVDQILVILLKVAMAVQV